MAKVSFCHMFTDQQFSRQLRAQFQSFSLHLPLRESGHSNAGVVFRPTFTFESRVECQHFFVPRKTSARRRS